MKTQPLFTKKSKILLLALSAMNFLASGSAFAVDAVGGSTTNTNVLVNTATWKVVASVSFRNTTQRYCTATGSADTVRPTQALGTSQYMFTVSNSNNPPFDQGQERTLEYFNQVGSLDNRIKEITTTGGWNLNTLANPGYFTVPANTNLFGNQTIYLLARKATAATLNLTVTDASLTVTCTDSRLAPSIIFPPVIVDTPVVINPIPVR